MRIPFLPDRVPELRRQPDVRSDIRAPLRTAQALRVACLRRDREADSDCEAHCNCEAHPGCDRCAYRDCEAHPGRDRRAYRYC